MSLVTKTIDSRILGLRDVTAETTSSLTWKPISDFIASAQLPVCLDVAKS